MTHQFDKKISPNRLQKVSGNSMIIFPDLNTRQSNPINRFNRVSVQHINLNSNSNVHSKQPEQIFVSDKEKAAQTGRWILNVIAARETYQQSKSVNKNEWYTDIKQQSSSKKKHSFTSRKSSRVEPIEILSSQFINTKIHPVQIPNNRNSNISRLPHEMISSPAMIENGQATPLSSFSSATSIDDIRTIEESSELSRTQSKDYSTDESHNSEKSCISKRMLIIFSIIAVIVIIGIVIAVFVTIFVGKNG
ncbi:unnamed protein product [Adineta steineri]|uniref:Uncharacterized protein n=1 Tax=Adineta steineri TaxID=433720 RepID=A0A814AM09_9BILA|nr:unnamed protein product [Adineta steineri]CAF0981703.1 unnamed protein product [Adineta steineri]